jgi:hypothetical protein
MSGVPALRPAAGPSFKQPPIMDANNGGSGVDYPETLAKAYATSRTSTQSSTVTCRTDDPAGLKDTGVNARLPPTRNQMKAGKSVDDAAAGYKVPDRFKGYTAAPARVKSDVQVIYDELGQKK